MQTTPPAAHIYVTANPRHLEQLAIGAHSWWCVERSAAVGEIGAVYVTGGKGFRFLFRLLGFAVAPEFLCQEHGLATGNIEIIARLETPISAQDLRSHAVLRSLPALRRSFQRRSFHLDEPFLEKLTALFKKRATFPPKRSQPK
jgi:hypothetical protein